MGRLKIGSGDRFTVASGESTRAGAVLWTPAQITTNGWWDASDSVTITQVGGKVSQWNDKSANGNNASQGTGAKQPSTGVATIGGLNATILSVTDAPSLNFDSDGGLMMFMVAVSRGFNDQGSFANVFFTKGQPVGSAAHFGIIMANNSATMQIHSAVQGGLTVSTAHTIATNVPFIASSKRINSTHWGYLNGSDAKSNIKVAPLLSDTNTFGFGGDGTASRYGDIDIGEVILIGGVPNDTNRQKVEGYLAWKWGLNGSLPLDHSYKYYAPII
jgi:hypothetical protein